MKTTIKKTITQEVELPLPYYSTDGDNYYMIVSENYNENVHLMCYDINNSYQIQNFASASNAVGESMKTITPEEFFEKMEYILNKLKYICSNQ